jgi:sialate O-acetylesterase
MPRCTFAVALPLTVSLALTILTAPAAAEVKLPPVLSSHMVLQRDIPLPLWGTAAPGEKVTVSFRDQEKSATADPQGKWLVKLDPLKAGGPDILKIAGTNTLALDDVLVGEVWVGSGQSNMAGGVAGYAKNDDVLAKLAAANYPKLRLKKSGNQGWQEATPQNNGGFSAILFAFGVRLQQDLDVPVGLMVGAVGGTPSGYWLSEEAYRSDAACKEVVQKLAAAYSSADAEKKHQQELERWEKAVAAAQQAGAKPPRKPDAPLKPGECRGKVGHLYEAHIRPYIPYGVRGVLWDQGESGTAITGVDQYTLMGALIRGWRKEWGQDFAFIYIQKPSGGGCAWDAADPVTQRGEKFSPLPAAVPGTADGLYVENHVRIMQYPQTAMATSSDLGPGIHPLNKSGYGTRAARVALGMVYGRKVEIYGPVYQSHKVEGNKARVSFTHVGQGLAYRHGEKLQGFAVAGEDKAFHWADAVIDGDAVVVSSDKVAKPAAVRYGWGRTYTWANLFNKDGLPALPFRTDAW